jgi:hypothetical protein
MVSTWLYMLTGCMVQFLSCMLHLLAHGPPKKLNHNENESQLYVVSSHAPLDGPKEYC